MTPATERRQRQRSLGDQLLVWIAPLSLILNLYFIREVYQDVRTIREDVQTLKIDVAVLKARAGVDQPVTP